MQTTPQNLNTFRILFLVKGILTLSFSIFFIIYGLFGFLFMKSIEVNDNYDGMPFSLDLILFTTLGTIMMVIAAIGFLFSIIIGILTLLASKYLKEIKNYNFIFAIAIINCITGILGIILGVFTLVELTKPEVKKLFKKA